MEREMLEYILFRLPIFSNTELSLEAISEEFKIPYFDECTQEELAERILNNYKGTVLKDEL